MTQQMKCVSCGANRKEGEVCCLAQAYNQRVQHAGCTHSAPKGLTPEMLEQYQMGKEDGIASAIAEEKGF